jgi:hypothetical protein
MSRSDYSLLVADRALADPGPSDIPERLRARYEATMLDETAAREIESLRAENQRMREALAACVPVVEAVMEDHGWLGEHEGIEGALEATGLIAWDVVPPSGEVHTHFDGWEDLEPGDSFWVATPKWTAALNLVKPVQETPHHERSEIPSRDGCS